MKTVLVLTLALAAIGLAAEASHTTAGFAELVEFYRYEAQMTNPPTRSAGEEMVLIDKPANYDALAALAEQFDRPKPAITQYTQEQLDFIVGVILEPIQTTPNPDEFDWDTFIGALPDVGVLDVDDPIAQEAYQATVKLLADPDFQTTFEDNVYLKEQGKRVGFVTGILIGWVAGHALDYICGVVTEAVQGAAESIQEAMQEADIDTTGLANQAPVIGTRGATLGAALAISEWFD